MIKFGGLEWFEILPIYNTMTLKSFHSYFFKVGKEIDSSINACDILVYIFTGNKKLG